MFPVLWPSKRRDRASSFSEPSDTKRRRVSHSPRPALDTLNAGEKTLGPRVPVIKASHAHPEPGYDTVSGLPALEPPCQSTGPEKDANKLLGNSTRQIVPMLWPSRRSDARSRPRSFVQEDEEESFQQKSPIQQRETPRANPIDRAISHRQQSRPPLSTGFRTIQYGQQPSPPLSDPVNAAAPPRVPFPSRPRQFKVPQRELAVQPVEFEELAAHTAKCDTCDKRNTDGMWRCKPCGWQCCRRCLSERGGDRSHPKAGNLHVPDDMVPPVQAPKADNLLKALFNRPRPEAYQPPAVPEVTPEEAAARILLTMKKDSWNRRGPLPRNEPSAGPSRTANQVLGGGIDVDSDETELLPGLNLDNETDEENLPDNLVNVRRNPSRRARPADMKE